MADRAPGQDAPKHEASCYNCGSKDHFVFACPEPTRSQPAGLEAFRQRQAANQMKGSSGNASHGNRSKGPIITRYGPPPGTGSSPPGYTPWMNGPPPPAPAPYQQPTPPGLPPQPVAFPPPPPGPPTPYSPYPPGPPQQGGYGQAYSPSVPAPVYSQYVPPGPPPQTNPLPYGPPAPYGPPVYNQQYPPPPNPAYPPTPQPYYSGPSPPAYPPYAPPPPPSNYQPGPYSPPSGPPYTPDSQYPPPLPPPPPTHWNQGSNNRNQHHNRGSRHNKDHRGRGPRHHGQHRGSSENSRRSASAAKDSPVASNSTPKSDHRDEHATPVEDDFEWELEKIFVEVKTKDADPVGRPLPPEYNDDPTIPPAFNAKCLKSEFFSETDQKGFSTSIRNTRFWASIRDDPSFKHYRGMVTIRFPDHPHEYSVYDLAHLQPDPSDDELYTAGNKGSSKRAIEDVHGDHDWRDNKRRKPLYPSERRSREDSPRMTSRSKSPLPGGRVSRSAERDVTDTLFNSLSDQANRNSARDQEERPNAPHNSTLRHDSGYQSAQSGDRRPEPWRERPTSQKSPSQRDRRRSRSSSQPQSRDRSPGARKMPSYSHSYDNDASDSDDSSQMSDMDYELLGLDRPAKKEKKKEPKQVMKRRRVKVNDAFSRRW